MGHKSKFTFPMPGRPSKPPPAVTISNPLSKAEKILGTGGMTLHSPTGTRDPGRSWETESSGGISISISESSASQSGVLDEDDDEDRFAGTTYGRALWEEESEALPGRLRSANGPYGKGLKTKTSAVTLGTRSRDAMTDETLTRRPQSSSTNYSSTNYSHYDPARLPLSISQQTSNSAMAKGLPTKAGALLDIDGALFGKGQLKKKPSKLDFSKLRLRSRKDQSSDTNGVGPVLGNNYVMRSPSIMSHMSHTIVSPTRPSPTSPGGDQITPRPDMTRPQTSGSTSTRPGRFKGTTDANTLHQLYDHYEQMSFRNAAELTEEDEEDVERYAESQQRLLPRKYEPKAPDVFREDMVTPLAHSMNRDPGARWNHSRSTSQASKATATRAGTPSTLQLRPISRGDYPASISSRHTRTSKATPSIMSALDSDRQQHSVLSLTDSESDDDSRPGSSLPSYDNNSSFRDDLSVSSSQRQPSTSRLSISSQSTNPKGASYAQLSDFLTIPHASPKSKGSSRTPSTNTLHSSNSTLSTATRTSLPSHQDPRASVSTTGTTGSILSPAYSSHTHYSVQEARAVAFTPLASTAEAASSVSGDHMPNNLDRILSQHTMQRVSQISHTSDQPTPPLSPTSVDFYKKSPETARREPAASNASEPHNARLMAVTRQEEMLLAALRKKRARMRENLIAEIEEDRTLSSRGSGSIEGSEKMPPTNPTNPKKAERHEAKEVRDARNARAKAKQPQHMPQRSSSLQRTGNGYGRFPIRSNIPPSTSHSDPTEKTSLQSRMSPEPEARRTGKARHERVLLYLDRPIDSIDVIDQAEPSPDLSEFMDEELEFPMPDRRSRIRSKMGSSPHSTPFHNGREAHGRPRPDSSPASPRSSSSKAMHSDQPGTNEDTDADDVDFDDLEDVVDRHRLGSLQPVPEKEVARPDSLVSPTELLVPLATSHRKNKKSAVRLSAVGQISSPIGSPVPWWGDDD